MSQKPEIKSPDKFPERTGLSLFFLVGGFVALIMIVGWIVLSMRG